MRAFCTVSAPLEVCASPSNPLQPGARFLALRWVYERNHSMSTSILSCWNVIIILLNSVWQHVRRLLGSPQTHTLYFLVEAKSRVREVYAQTCLHFAKQGMLDTELFGLAILIGLLKQLYIRNIIGIFIFTYRPHRMPDFFFKPNIAFLTKRNPFCFQYTYTLEIMIIFK